MSLTKKSNSTGYTDEEFKEYLEKRFKTKWLETPAGELVYMALWPEILIIIAGISFLSFVCVYFCSS